LKRVLEVFACVYPIGLYRVSGKKVSLLIELLEGILLKIQL